MGIVTDLFLPLSLAFIMFSLGLSLSLGDFVRIAKQPRDFFIGALLQIVLLPLIALVLVLIWPISPELAVGVMLIAAAPGGATSNIITSFSKGDVALSVSLTAAISLLSVITIPVILLISLKILMGTSLEKEISVLSIALQVFLIVTIPVIVGMLFRKFVESYAISFEPISKKISAFLFAVVLLGAVASQKDNITEYFVEAGIITLALNIIMMTVAFYIARFFSLEKPQQKTIIIECGLQNGTLAIVVATTVFDGGVYIIPAATYSLIMFFSSLIFISISRKNI